MSLLTRFCPALFVLLIWPTAAWCQESVQMAQSLYASASYDEALAVLERLQQQQPTQSEVLAINQQRALCLLALGRAQEAESAITAVVQTDPTYRADGTSVSPRVRTAFRDVRTRLLPGIVQADYAQARKFYDSKSWAESAATFRRVIALSTDPDLSPAQVNSLNDIKTLAEGFAKLAESAATPAPAAPPPPAPEPEAPAKPAVDYDAVFDGSEPNVTLPVTLRQDVPRWIQSALPIPRSTGLLEITISKNGAVERATLTQPIVGFYDRQVLEATKNWRYRPATVDGQPVRFKKTIRISFQ